MPDSYLKLPGQLQRLANRYPGTASYFDTYHGRVLDLQFRLSDDESSLIITHANNDGEPVILTLSMRGALDNETYRVLRIMVTIHNAAPHMTVVTLHKLAIECQRVAASGKMIPLVRISTPGK